MSQFAPNNLQVPPGFEYILEGLTREVLREQPLDIITFAADYFRKKFTPRARDDSESGLDQRPSDASSHRPSVPVMPLPETSPFHPVNRKISGSLDPSTTPPSPRNTIPDLSVISPPQTLPHHDATSPRGSNATSPRGSNATSPRGASPHGSVAEAATSPRGSNAASPRGSNAASPRGSNAASPRGSNAVSPRGSIAASPHGSVAEVSTLPRGSNAISPRGSNAASPHGSVAEVSTSPRGSNVVSPHGSNAASPRGSNAEVSTSPRGSSTKVPDEPDFGTDDTKIPSPPDVAITTSPPDDTVANAALPPSDDAITTSLPPGDTVATPDGPSPRHNSADIDTEKTKPEGGDSEAKDDIAPDNSKVDT